MVEIFPGVILDWVGGSEDLGKKTEQGENSTGQKNKRKVFCG